MLACLVEGSIEKAPFSVVQRNDPPIDRDAIYMNVEHIHENAEPLSRFRTQTEFGRRNGLENRKQLSVRRTDDQTRASRCDAIGIAEKRHAPEREGRECESSPGREHEQQKIASEEHSDEAPTVAMDGNSQTASIPL